VAVILCYCAGPYSAETPEAVQANVDAAIDAGNRLMDAGVGVIVPHLSHYPHARRPRGYEEWMALDFELLSRCDVLLRLPGASPGADREVLFAVGEYIPVFSDVAQVARYARGLQ
jgi:hypothetical protein